MTDNQNTFTVTDDQLHWLQVALDNSLDSARRLMGEGNDLDDQLDGGLLVNRYTELQGIIGEPRMIGE